MALPLPPVPNPVSSLSPPLFQAKALGKWSQPLKSHSYLLCSLSEGRPTTLLLLPFTGVLSEACYGEEQIFEEGGSELNSEDSDVQEVLPVPNAWTSLGNKEKMG